MNTVHAQQIQTINFGVFMNPSYDRFMKSYKVVVYKEGLLGSLLLGASRVDAIRFSEFLNQNAADGWEVVTMDKDIRREFLFFKREAYVVIMVKTQ